jgi:hypothetical protein
MTPVLATHRYREISIETRHIHVEVLFNPMTGAVKDFFGLSREEAKEIADTSPRLINIPNVRNVIWVEARFDPHEHWAEVRAV